MIDDTIIPVYLIHGCGFIGKLTIKEYPLFMVEYFNGFVNCLKCKTILTTKNSLMVQDEIGSGLSTKS